MEALAETVNQRFGNAEFFSAMPAVFNARAVTALAVPPVHVTLRLRRNPVVAVAVAVAFNELPTSSSATNVPVNVSVCCAFADAANAEIAATSSAFFFSGFISVSLLLNNNVTSGIPRLPRIVVWKSHQTKNIDRNAHKPGIFTCLKT